MMTKTAYYMQMAQEAAAQITGSKEQWTAFLTTSARLYKYPFAEQLMIYKQRPEATACAEYDLWNDRMNRYVKRGSKGIALLDMRGEQPKLRYVFDVADTGERKNSRPVQLWKMNAEHEQPIIRALDTAFDVPAGVGSLENHIMEAAEHLARDYWEENRRQISDIVADSYLEGYDELNIGASFKRAAAVSIAFSVFTRTVGNADDYFEHEDFLDIFDFNTQAAANVLGTAVSEMSSQIFREIERTIRTYERDKQAERSQNYDGAELHEERRLPDSGHPVVGAGTEASGQVREDAQRLLFLQENNTLLYNHLILTEKLYPHLWEIQETATARMEQMMAELLKANPAPDKKSNQLAWVQHMNMLKAQAEEVILTELINS